MVPDRSKGEVRVIGTPLPYQDGAESALLDIITAADDVSSGSDELARHIRDWPTRYHLARARTHVLRPLRIEPGIRVLDVGAGTGVHARFFGERGAEVVALEGSLDRANVASARCRDLPNVEVVCGPIDAFTDDTGFDVVVAIGVLEYSGDPIGGAAGPMALLRRLRELTVPDGAVVVTVENQIGLKYLLGCAEDHLGLPWIGVEGYPLATGVRTFPRGVLRRMLEEAGLGAQHWIYAFPDYKLPKVLFTDATYAEPSAARLIDQLAPHPVRDFAHPRYFLADDRGVHQTFVEAGLGPEVANSFLVVAATDETSLERRVDREPLVWHFGDERLRQWMRVKAIRRRNGTLTIESQMAWPGRAPRQRDWLRQNGEDAHPYVDGPTLEQLVRRALGSGDRDDVAQLLTRWRDHLLSIAALWDGEVTPEHPFILPTTSVVLPPDHLDVELGNFVVAEDDTLHFVDFEWWLEGGIDVDLACLRALWWLARELITSGEARAWPSSTTVDELASVLGSWCGFSVPTGLVGTWCRAESELQGRVHGTAEHEVYRALLEDGSSSLERHAATRSLPFSRLAAEAGRLHGEAGHLHREFQSLRAAHEGSRSALEAVRGQLAEAQDTISKLQAELEANHGELAAKRGELAGAVAEIRDLRSSTSWRITAPARTLMDGLRRVIGRGRGG